MESKINGYSDQGRHINNSKDKGAQNTFSALAHLSEKLSLGKGISYDAQSELQAEVDPAQTQADMCQIIKTERNILLVLNELCQ